MYVCVSVCTCGGHCIKMGMCELGAKFILEAEGNMKECPMSGLKALQGLHYTPV